jgi:hypothetical protein
MIWAQAEVVQYFDNGSINWSTDKVIVMGIGAPPANAANMAQARAMARRAAITVARRNLLEITQGVQLDSLTLVKDFIVQSDVVRTSVQGVVRNAQVIDTAYMSDGSVEVTMMMNLTGEFANVVLPPAPKVTQPPSPTVTQPPSPTVTQPPSPAVPEMGTPEETYTGLVVDARGLGARPAMSPKVHSESGKEIYGSAMVNRQYAVQQGMVGYAKDLTAAQTNSRVTKHPLTVKATRVSGAANCDFVISDSDASRLLNAAENLTFLQKCRVMVVLD